MRLTNVRSVLQKVRKINCVCRGLNTEKVKDALAAGARSPAQVHAHHGTTINCGKCCEIMGGMIRERQLPDYEPPRRPLAAE